MTSDRDQSAHPISAEADMSFRPNTQRPPGREPDLRPTLIDPIPAKADVIRQIEEMMAETNRYRNARLRDPLLVGDSRRQTKFWLHEIEQHLLIMRYDLRCLFEERPVDLADQVREKLISCQELMAPIQEARKTKT